VETAATKPAAVAPSQPAMENSGVEKTSLRTEFYDEA
jgi:hypothetical protein